MNDGRNTIGEKIAENLNIVINAVQETLEKSSIMKEVVLASVMATVCEELNIDKRTTAFILFLTDDYNPENMSEQVMQQAKELSKESPIEDKQTTTLVDEGKEAPQEMIIGMDVAERLFNETDLKNIRKMQRRLW